MKAIFVSVTLAASLSTVSCDKSQVPVEAVAGAYRVANASLPPGGTSLKTALAIAIGKGAIPASIRIDSRSVIFYAADGTVIEQTTIASQNTEGGTITLLLSNNQPAVLKKQSGNVLQLQVGEISYTLTGEAKKTT